MSKDEPRGGKEITDQGGEDRDAVTAPQLNTEAGAARWLWERRIEEKKTGRI